METIGDKIKFLRELKGLTYEELGNRVGVGKSTVRKWEKGMIVNMKRDKIKKLSDALGVSPSYLMGWTNSPLEDNIIADITMSVGTDNSLIKVNDKKIPTPPQFEVNEQEYNLIKKYNCLSEQWKTVVDKSIESGYEEYLKDHPLGTTNPFFDLLDRYEENS